MVCKRISFSRLDSLSLSLVSLLIVPLSLSREKLLHGVEWGVAFCISYMFSFLRNSLRDDSCHNKHNRALSPIRRTSFVPETFLVGITISQVMAKCEMVFIAQLHLLRKIWKLFRAGLSSYFTNDHSVSFFMYAVWITIFLLKKASSFFTAFICFDMEISVYQFFGFSYELLVKLVEPVCVVGYS